MNRYEGGAAAEFFRDNGISFEWDGYTVLKVNRDYMCQFCNKLNLNEEDSYKFVLESLVSDTHRLFYWGIKDGDWFHLECKES